MRSNLILIIVLFFSSTAFGQQSDTLNYVIIVKKDTIGNLTAVKNSYPDSSFTYVVKSIAEYKLLFTFKINFDYFTRFDPDGFISETDFVYRFNEKIKEENKLERNNSGYDIYVEKEFLKTVEGLYTQSALTMYFTEPDINKPILSERFLDKIKIERVKTHDYRVEFPTEDVNYYFYKNGVCQKILIDMTITDMEIQLLD